MEAALARSMTRPMPVLPNTTYMETRRCSERRFFFKPSKRSNQIYLYCLALAAEKYNVEIHCFCVESNHEHNNTTDTMGNHPEFRQLKNSLIGRAMNVELRRHEAFWAPTDREVVELADEGAQTDAYAYTLANPVKDGLVPYGHQWPGPRSKPSDIGKELVIKRPVGGFFKNSTLPEEVTLKLTVPPALRHLPIEEAIATLEGAVVAAEASYREKRRKKKQPFLGRRAVRKRSAFDAPKARRPFRRLNPRLKCSNPSLMQKLVQRLKDFWNAYAAAREAWLNKEHSALFPCGTYQLRLLYGVPIASG